MNDFTYLAGGNGGTFQLAELPEISMRLAETPIGPMDYKSPVYMLEQLVEKSAV